MTAASQSGRRLTCLGWTPRDTVSLATVGHGGAINTGHPLPTRTNRQDELTSSRAAPELREAADAILRSFSAGGGEMSGGSNLLTISRSHSAAAFSTTKASAEAPAARPEGDDARAAPKRDPARMKQMAGPASAFLLNKWLHAGVLLVLFLASGPRTVRYACNAAPDACLWMPPSVSGFTFMPVNDNHLLVDGTPVVFDGFLAQYRCTKNASRKGHHPTMLFRSPKLALSVGSVQTNPSTGTRLDLLVGILSGCSSSGLRSAVRQTWQR